MRDSWIDKDELDELVGSFAAPRKGRSRRAVSRPKTPPRKPEDVAALAISEPEAPGGTSPGVSVAGEFETALPTICGEVSGEIATVAAEEPGQCFPASPGGSDGTPPSIAEIFEFDEDSEENDLIIVQIDEESVFDAAREADGIVIEVSRPSQELLSEIPNTEFAAGGGSAVVPLEDAGSGVFDFPESGDGMPPSLGDVEESLPTPFDLLAPIGAELSDLAQTPVALVDSGRAVQESCGDPVRDREAVGDRPEFANEIPAALSKAPESSFEYSDAIILTALDISIPQLLQDAEDETRDDLEEEEAGSDGPSRLTGRIPTPLPEGWGGMHESPAVDVSLEDDPGAPVESGFLIGVGPSIGKDEPREAFTSSGDGGIDHSSTELDGISIQMPDAMESAEEGLKDSLNLIEVVSSVEEELVVSAYAEQETFRELPQFLDDADDFVPRTPSLLERDADRALIALAEARARAERGGLLRGYGHAAGGFSTLPKESEGEGQLPLQEELFPQETEVPVLRESDPVPEGGGNEEGVPFDDADGPDDLPETRGALSDRVANFVIRACAELGASAGAVSDRDGFLLYAHSELEDDDDLQTALLLEVSGQTDRLLGGERGRATQVSIGGDTWRCLIRGGDPEGGLYAGFQLNRPLDLEEIERWRIFLGQALAPVPDGA